ncbi:MAG: hypothetical protein GKR97_05410 [Rhizobiaceae bacterium]|nr:hypothetical protein [Rhizobiaceae bacterium]
MADTFLGPAEFQYLSDEIAQQLADQILQRLEFGETFSTVMVNDQRDGQATIRIVAAGPAVNELHRQLDTIIEGLKP